MSDEELITALRMRAESELCRAAADRIEALVDEWSKDGEEILSLREKVEKLRGALTLAANRLSRRAVEYVPGGRLFIETGEWADEARAASAEADNG